MPKNIFSLEGKTVVVIGGASGIGEAIVGGAVDTGARVHCLDINADAAAAIAASAGCESGALNVCDAAAVNATLDGIARTHGLDAVISTPGVNAIAPGVIETPLTAPINANEGWYNAYAAKSVFNRWGQPAEIVGPTLFLASDAASFVTGTTIYADGGWTAIDGRFTPPGM